MNLGKNERDLRSSTDAGKKAAQRSRGMRESLYRHIHVSVRTMNIIICVLALLLIASIAMGVIQGR